MNKSFVITGSALMAIGFVLFLYEYNYVTLANAIASEPLGIAAFNNTAFVSAYHLSSVMESFFGGVVVAGICMLTIGLSMKV